MRRMNDIVCYQNPVTLPPTATVKQAANAMHKHRVGAVLVVNEDGTLCGIFTGRDAVGRGLAAAKDPTETVLPDVITYNPDFLPPHSKVIEAMRLMEDGGFRHVPVVKEGKLLGVVSKGDFQGLETAQMDHESVLWEVV